MSNNTTSSCTFSSISDFLAQAEAGKLNVSTTIEQCPGICSLAWGYGNPDLSGIGANASYIIQAILIFFFSPVLIVLYRWVVRSKFRRKQLQKSLGVFLDTSAQFTIPVSVAAIVRIKQSAPFYEITFLQSLMTMQFLGLLATILTYACISYWYEEEMKSTKKSATEENADSHVPRIIVVSLYGLIDFSLYMGLVHHLHASKASYLSLQQLAASCTSYGSLLPGFVYVQSPHPHGLTLPKVSKPNDYGLDWADDKTSFHNLGIILGIVVAAILVMVILCYLKNVIGYILAFLGMVAAGAVCISPFAFSVAVIYCLVELEQKRNMMKGITGAEFQDNEWGFGQVVALFLWVPLLFQTLYWAIEYDKSQAQDDHENPKTEKGNQSVITSHATKEADSKIAEVQAENSRVIEVPGDGSHATGHDNQDCTTSDDINMIS